MKDPQKEAEYGTGFCDVSCRLAIKLGVVTQGTKQKV